MIITSYAQTKESAVSMQGAKDVTIRIPLGPECGSENIVMRIFKMAPGGYTPLHTHDFEHLVKVESGMGVVVDKNGNEHEIQPGQFVLVPSNESHQFKNPYPEPFEFMCVILNQDKK